MDLTSHEDDAQETTSVYRQQNQSRTGPLAALPVTQLRAQADDLARQIREIDVRIQQSNWEHDLLE